jgi:competence protein ComEC
MHVLAVSGLHVGIIFFVLRFLLSWMDKLKNGIAIKAVILILCIWLYAFVTGLSPSVIRASTMFSFMIVAISFKRTSNIYNTLALSAFAILMYEPFMLLEVGFQLSYLAVIGIIYLHPYLYALIELPPGLVDKAWNITCVSLSAQLVTAPLGILYFHQFPTYFLFSNLIVIPAAFLIIFMAIGFQILSIIPYVGELVAFLLKWVIFSLNWMVKAMQELPNALIAGLDITVLETWFMYLIIGFITIWLTQYNRKFMLYSLGVILALSASQTFEKWVLLHQKEITFYNTGKQPSIEYVNGLNSVFIADTSLLSNTDKMQFYVYHHRWKRGLRTTQLEASEDFTNVAILGNTKTLTIDNEHLFTAKQVETFLPDILYFNTYKYWYVKELSKLSYQPKIIIGAATSRKAAQMLVEFCQTNHWEYYTIRKDGAVKVLLTEDLRPMEFNHQKHH